MNYRLGSKRWKLEGCGKFYDAIFMKGGAIALGLVPFLPYLGSRRLEKS